MFLGRACSAGALQMRRPAEALLVSRFLRRWEGFVVLLREKDLPQRFKALWKKPKPNKTRQPSLDCR